MSETFNYHRFFRKFPVIELGNIVLRDLLLSDRQEYLDMMSDPLVTKYLSDEDVPTNLDEAMREIKYWGNLFYAKQSVFWAVADKSNDKMIGTIGYNSWNFYNRRAEISYDLIPSYWRQGIMTRALRNALMFGFREMNLLRIEARTMLGNEASMNLLKKMGFKQEGVLRSYRIIRSEPTDITLFSLLKHEFSSLWG